MDRSNNYNSGRYFSKEYNYCDSDVSIFIDHFSVHIVDLELFCKETPGVVLRKEMFTIL